MPVFLYQNKAIHYQDVGTGKVVMLVHGFAEDAQVWQPLVGKLACTHRIIVPDLPGFGASDFIDGLTLEAVAELLYALFKSLEATQEPQQVTLFGHSMGGYISLAFAQKFGTVVNGLSLVHSSAFADLEEKKVARKKSIAFIQQHGTLPFLQTASPGLFAPAFAVAQPAVIQQYIQHNQHITASTLVQYYEAMMARQDYTDLLRTFDRPIQFTIGELDQAVPLATSLAQCYLPKQAHVHLLPNVAHMSMYEAPEQLLHLVQQYLQYLSE